MKNRAFKICYFVFLFSVLTLTGCTRENDSAANQQSAETSILEEADKPKEESTEKSARTEKAEEEIPEEAVEPMINEADWADYFEELNGAAVIYDPAANCYQIYNQELALTQRPPCSTFKIIS